MNELVVGIVVLLVGSLITFATYRYRNKIVYELAVVIADATVVGNKIILDAQAGDVRQLNAVLLKVTNRGWRTLKDVGLHLTTRNHAKRIEVGEPTTLSKSAIKLEVSDSEIKIDIATLPPNESFEISFFSLGWREYGTTELKSTGGQFKIVEKARYDLTQSLWRDLPFYITIVGLIILLNQTKWK